MPRSSRMPSAPVTMNATGIDTSSEYSAAPGGRYARNTCWVTKVA